MVSSFCKRHFAADQFRPIHTDPSVFMASQWQRNKTIPNFKYLLYRTVIMLIFFVTWITTIVKESGARKWPIFLTNWGYTTCTIQALLAWLMLASSIVGYARNKPSLKKFGHTVYPLYWVLNTSATPLAFGITTIYWSVLYDANNTQYQTMNYMVHGNNTILMFIDLLVLAHPVRLLHFIYPMILGIFYASFTLIYYSTGGLNIDGKRCIYPIVDWDAPGPTIGVCIGVIVFLIVLHSIIFLIYLLRRNIEEKYCCKKLETGKRRSLNANQAMLNEIV